MLTVWHTTGIQSLFTKQRNKTMSLTLITHQGNTDTKHPEL